MKKMRQIILMGKTLKEMGDGKQVTRRAL